MGPPEQSDRAETPEPATITQLLCVIVPARDAVTEIAACIAALVAGGFSTSEIVVVDDGSVDGTGDAAAACGARVIRNPAPLRPARARNLGVAATRSEVLVFVDADVLVQSGTRDRIAGFFAAHPDHNAVFGSYDDDPPATRAVGRYRNLLHHFVHQNSRMEATTFWTGLGAVRRAAFESVGPFDPAWESIEDVEFGLRLSERGSRIRLDRQLLGAHLKDWTLRSMFLTDWKGRAVPWTLLLQRGRTGPGDLNLTVTHRLSAALVGVAFLSALLAPVAPKLLILTLLSVVAFLAANLRFFAFLVRRQGWLFAAQATLFHAVHYFAALAGYLQVRLFDALAARLSKEKGRNRPA